MIDRKTFLAGAAIIALMLALAGWRIMTLEDWTTLAIQNSKPLPSLLLFGFPAAGALVVGALYWSGLRARAELVKLQPWYKWGRFNTISYCIGLLLLEGVVVVLSLDRHLPLNLWAVYRALGVVMAMTSLLMINQMPKLPYFERSASPGGDLGPIYGPRFVRTVSKVLVVFMIAVIAMSLATSLAASPSMGWRPVLVILLAAAFIMVWSIAWRRQLGRKWSLEQLGARRLQS
jgi:hypothetical protein